MRRGSGSRSRRALMLLAAVTAVVTACSAAGSPAVRSTGSTVAPSSTTTTTTLPPGPVMGRAAAPGRVVTLTSTSGQVYDYTGDPRQTTARVGHDGEDVDGNVREVFWPSGTPYRLDHDVCMTWHDPVTTQDHSQPQPGLALRVWPVGNDGSDVRAVTITQNVFYGSIWYAWLNVWDTTEGTRPTAVSAFNLFEIVGVTAETMRAPWYVCGRIRGDEVSFKVWTEGPEPTWSDGDHVFTATLPPGWNEPGYAGGYIGHLRTGDTATFGDITVD